MVFHEAAIPSVPRSIDDPVPSHEVNIDGTFNVLRAAQEGKAGRVVYAASSSAYGDTKVLPKVEDMTPHPKSPYALQKLVGEYYLNVFSGVYGLETVSLRYFNVYGPRQDPSSPYSGVLSLFMKRRAAAPGPHHFRRRRAIPRLHLCGGCRRSQPQSGSRQERVRQASINGGNGGRITLNEAWALLQKIEGVSIAPVFGPPRSGDVLHSQADTTAAVRELGHDPRFSFDEGMRRTLEWYRHSVQAAHP